MSKQRMVSDSRNIRKSARLVNTLCVITVEFRGRRLQGGAKGAEPLAVRCNDGLKFYYLFPAILAMIISINCKFITKIADS
jgi:hypothetical protein